MRKRKSVVVRWRYAVGEPCKDFYAQLSGLAFFGSASVPLPLLQRLHIGILCILY